MPGDDEQVCRDDRRPDVCLERRQAPPRASPQSEAPLEEGDHSLNASPEALQSLVYPAALDHRRDLQASPLAEGNIFNPHVLDLVKVGLRRETTIERSLPRKQAVKDFMPFNHLHCQGRVCWIAILDYAIGHQPRGTGGQAQLVSIERIPPVLLDDVGVGLEDGDELVGRGNAFAGEYPPFSLGDDLVGQLDVVSQFLRHPLGHESAHEVQSLGAHQWGIGSLGEAGRRTGDLQQIAIEPRTLLRSRAADPDEPTLGASAVVREGEADQLLGQVHESDQDTDTIPQQRGVGGSMDVRLHAGAVHPDLATVLDSRAVGVSNQGLVDRLECLWPETLDVALEGGPGRRLVVDAEPTKSLVASRVGQVEGEFLVAEAVHLLDDYGPDYLLGRHAISTGIGPATLQGQIGEHEFGDGRLLVQDLAHDHQLEAVNVVDMEVDNRDLRLYDLPHRVIRPFPCCVLANSLYRIGAISSRYFFLIALSFSAVQAFRTGTT